MCREARLDVRHRYAHGEEVFERRRGDSGKLRPCSITRSQRTVHVPLLVLQEVSLLCSPAPGGRSIVRDVWETALAPRASETGNSTAKFPWHGTRTLSCEYRVIQESLAAAVVSSSSSSALDTPKAREQTGGLLCEYCNTDQCAILFL